jgi:hypothetical protein
MPTSSSKPMNLVSLSDAQLQFLTGLVTKAGNEVGEDLDAGDDLSDTSAEVLNAYWQACLDILKELNDCNTPKVVPAPTSQQHSEPVWEGTTATAKVLGVEAKKLYNLKQNGRLRPGYHFRKEGKAITWNVATVGQFLSENSH